MTMIETRSAQGGDVGTVELSDEELAAIALAADPDVEADPDAVPWMVAGAFESGLLPTWYMPAPVRSRQGWLPRVAGALVIASFLVINAFGFCITYGHLTAV